MDKEIPIKYKHIGNGEFVAEMSDGSLKSLGPNAVGVIKYTYFEDHEPPINWEVTRRKLIEDYQPKMIKHFNKMGK